MRGILILLLAWAALPMPAKAQGCDESLWKHVYHPQRLIVKQQCLTVKGTIVDATKAKHKDGLRHEADGDTHGWLKLDPGQEALLDAGNLSNEGGNLVFEVVCKYRVTQQDALEACRGYKNTIVIPRVGTHVCVTGSYVQDQEHAKWMEIHPVTRIEAC
jgi:hypothetical protein